MRGTIEGPRLNLGSGLLKVSQSSFNPLSFKAGLNTAPQSRDASKAQLLKARGTNKLYDFKNVDLRQSRLTQNKKKIRDTFSSAALHLRGTMAQKHLKLPTFRAMNDTQRVEIIQMFTEQMMDICK
mgnify:FL=1